MTEAYVAFDLDNTLGFFEYTNPLSFFWSPEMLTNPEQAHVNPGIKLRPPPHSLLRCLAHARQLFVHWLLSSREEEPVPKSILHKILRPNLATLLAPLLRLRKKGLLKTVIIYSNTGVGPSLEFAKELIETKFGCHGLFDLLADHWHPLRRHDQFKAGSMAAAAGELRKTPRVLKALFKEAAGARRRSTSPSSDQILFVDDFLPKHEIQEEEAKGLTYIVPTPYCSSLSLSEKKALVAAAIECLHRAGVLDDPDYAVFYTRKIPFEHEHTIELESFSDLAEFVLGEVIVTEPRYGAWRNDTRDLQSQMTTFLEKIESRGKKAHDAE